MTATEEVHERAHEEPGQITAAPQTLAEKIVAAALEIGAVEKSGYNAKQDYHFARGDDVIEAVRGPLLQRGVLVLGGKQQIVDSERATRAGGVTVISTLEIEFIFLDAQTGEKLALPWAGRGEDPGDKGLGKGFTNALKTFLRQQLLIPWGHDDPEADTGSDERVGGTANLVEQARGLSNAQLNAVLVKVGLGAQQAPFGAFLRIPSEKAEQVTAALAEEKRG